MSKGLEDCKFICKISCEPRIAAKQDAITMAQKIIGVRVKMFDEITKELLKQIAEEKGYSEILAIDENKVDNFIKSLKALEIIKSKNVDVVYFRWQCNRLEDYNENNQICELDKDEYLTKEEFNLLKEVFL